MPMLSVSELHMVAEEVSEPAKLRRTSFDRAAIGFRLARAALIDPKFKAKLLDLYRRPQAPG